MHKLKIVYRFAPVRLVLVCAGLVVLLMAGCAPKASVSREVPTSTPFLPGMFPQTAGTQIAADVTADVAARAQVATIVAQTMQARPALSTAAAPTSTPANTQTSLPPNTPTQPAPSLVPSPTTTLLDAGCLAGTWEVANLADSVSASPAAEGLAVQSIAGRLVYAFDPSGSLTITFDQLNAILSGTVNKHRVNAVESFNGSALANYQVDALNQQIILSNFGGEGIRVGVDINGQRLAEGDLPAWQAFTSGPSAQQAGTPVQSSHAQVVCSGGDLTIRVLDPVGGPELHLTRK